MTASAPAPVSRWVGWKLLLVGTLAQAALARLCVVFNMMNGNVSSVWPATGLGIWMLVVRGPGMWPAIAAGQVLISLHSRLPFSVALGMGAGSALEALLGAWLWHTAATRWRRYFGEHTALVVSFVVAAIAPLTAASVGNLALWLGGIIPATALGPSWLTWWVGDALGALFVVPLLLEGPALGRWLRTAGRSEWNRGLAVLAAIGTVCALAFFMPHAGAFLFGVFPVLLLAARWLPAPASAAAAALVAITAVVATAGGHGPFTSGELNNDLINLQTFLVAVAIISRLLPTLHERGSLVPSLILLVGWTVSGGLFAALQLAQLRETRANFAALTANATTDIEGRLEVYVDALRGGASHLIAAPESGRAGWSAFFESLRLNERYPGVYGYGVIFPVASAGTEAFEQRMRADGEPEFTIHPVKGAPAAKDREHFVIAHSAAGSEHRRSLGLDIATEAARREAAEAARASGKPRITGRITLTVKEVKHTGFLLLLPVYRSGRPVTTAAEREAAFLAWIYAPFLMDEFIPAALQKRSGNLQLNLYAGDRTDEDHLLYSSTPAGRTRRNSRT